MLYEVITRSAIKKALDAGFLITLEDMRIGALVIPNPSEEGEMNTLKANVIFKQNRDLLNHLARFWDR